MPIRRILYIAACLFLLSACGAYEPTGPQVDDFSFTNQNAQAFGTDDLTGKAWVASFIFTNCDTVCPPMMSEMASLQRHAEEKGLQVEFVSFTVDPEVDSPEVLQQYVQQFTDNESNWHMLTGYSQEEIERFARDQFHTLVLKPENAHHVIHGTNFYLVDHQGYVFQDYNYIDDSYIELMMADIKKMNKRYPS